jgi:chromosome partitioning protein
VAAAYTIVFANAKGGVGKTTSAVHVAGAFAETGAQTVHLGLDPDQVGVTVTDVLIEPSAGLARAVVPTRYERLACVPAHASLGEMESELSVIGGREDLLTDAWRADPPPARMAVLDVPPALSLYTVNALRAADAVVVPVQTHPFALSTVPRTLDLVDRIRRRLNPGLRLLGFLATLYDRRTRVGRECLARMEGEWGEALLGTVIPVNVALAEAAREGRLLYEIDPDSAGAAAYYDVAREIAERVAARPTRVPAGDAA